MISPIQHIEIPNGKMDYYPLFLTATESKEFMRILKAEVGWKQDERMIFEEAEFDRALNERTPEGVGRAFYS